MRKLVLGFVLGALAFASLSSADDEPRPSTRWSGVVQHDIALAVSTPVEVARVYTDGRVELGKGYTCEDALRSYAGLRRTSAGKWTSSP